jgi:hypothetical protein
VFRAGLDSAFVESVSSAARIAATTLPVITIPTDSSFLGLSFCAAPRPHCALSRRMIRWRDSPAHKSTRSGD